MLLGVWQQDLFNYQFRQEVEKTLIKGQIDNKIYHIEFVSSASDNNIEIHLNGIADNSLELMKGNEE